MLGVLLAVNGLFDGC